MHGANMKIPFGNYRPIDQELSVWSFCLILVRFWFRL